MSPSEETLMAYVDGELDAAAREQVAGAIAADPEVARRAAAHEALRGRLRATFDKVLEEPVPPQLVARVRLQANEPTGGRLLSLPGRRTPQRAWLQWSSLAASFLLGALVWQFAARLYAPGSLRETNGEFVASGTLARALSGQLSAQRNTSDAVQIGLSFRSRRGDYCRTFRLNGSLGTAGLACHDNDVWRVQVLAHDERPPAAPGQYRQAASSLPPTVLRAIDEMIAGDPLDAAAEAQVRASGWQGKP